MTEREQFEKWWDGAFTSGDREEKYTAWCGWQAARAASPKVPEGMAIVPVERTFEAGARAFKNLMIEASHAAIHPHIEGVYGAFEHRLAATKEKGE